MTTKNQISSRFIEAYEALLKNNQVTDKRDFSTKLGISASMITEITKGRSSVGTSTIQNIVSVFHIDANWLLTGRGPMLLPQDGTKEVPAKPTSHSPISEESDSIPLIPIEAMAGALTTEQTVLDYECERYVVPAFKGADFLIRITGDSMAPTYRSGDLVACKRVPMSGLFFQWNKVYVIDTDQGPLIKRIKPGCDKEHILIVSDNSDYDPFELPVSAIHTVALVIGVSRLE